MGVLHIGRGVKAGVIIPLVRNEASHAWYGVTYGGGLLSSGTHIHPVTLVMVFLRMTSRRSLRLARVKKQRIVSNLIAVDEFYPNGILIHIVSLRTALSPRTMPKG